MELEYFDEVVRFIVVCCIEVEIGVCNIDYIVNWMILFELLIELFI